MPEMYNSLQESGSEYGGINNTSATVQPKPQTALSAGEVLRLGYLTGDEKDTESLEDRRQMMGLRPADGRRPNYLEGTGIESQAQIEELGWHE